MDESSSNSPSDHKNSNQNEMQIRSASLAQSRISYVFCIAVFIGTIAFFNGIFSPWGYTRIKTTETMKILQRYHLTEHINSLTAAISDNLFRYESHVWLLYEHTAFRTGLFSCNSDSISSFIDYCLATHNNRQIPSNYFALIEDQDNFCQMEFNNTNERTFTLTYMLEDPLSHQKYFKQYTNEDFSISEIWDPYSTGSLVENAIYYNYFETFNLSDQYDFWSRFIPSVKQVNPPVITFSIIHSQTPQILASSSIIISDFLDFIDIFNTDSSEKFIAILDKNNHFIFDSFSQIATPKYVRNDSIPVYPHFNESTNEIWKAANQVVQNDETVYVFELDRSQFYVERKPIKLNSTLFGTVYIAYNFTSFYSRMGIEGTLDILIALIQSLVICLISLLCCSFNKKQTLHRLQKSIGEKKPPGVLEFSGGVGLGISKIRSLELELPEEAQMNKQLDLAVEQLTRYDHAVFSKAQDSCECPFCKHFISKRPMQSIDSSEGYSSWDTITGQNIPELKLLDFQAILDNPKRRILVLFSTMMKQFHLVFQWLDPDELIAFMSNYIDHRNMSNYHTALKLEVMLWSFSMMFPKWMKSKVHGFSLIFSGFIANPKWPPDDPEILQQANLYTDSKSTTKLKLKYIKKLLAPLNIPGPILQIIMESIESNIDNHQVFNSISKFRIAMETPDFSLDNQEDVALVNRMSSKFYDFVEYLIPTEYMQIFLDIQVDYYFTKEEKEDPDFITEYHYNVAKNIIGLWFDLFSAFGKPKTLYENLLKNIEYLESKRPPI